MSLVLPSTVEEINQLQQSYDVTTKTSFYREFNKGFENIQVEKRFKREVSLPNGVENWNISNFDSYLNFEDNLVSDGFKVIECSEDRLVPDDCNSRSRCDSFSSMHSASLDDKRSGSSIMFQGYGVKTFNTICVDSGSTCISSDHSYVNSSSESFLRGFDAEETYQNLDLLLQQVPEMPVSENLPSPLSMCNSDSNFEIPGLQNSYSMHSATSCNQDSLLELPRASKRPASTSSEDDIFSLRTAKQLCPSPTPVHYSDLRKKNNVASKTCRKTRKEKQKEMEVRVTELEKEKEGLRVEVQVLEELIQAHKMQLYAILQKR